MDTMIKRILMISATALLTACGGGGGGTGGETPVTQPPVTDPGGDNPPVVNPPIATGDRAGAYIGDFGSGEGVYVLGADNALSGLALAADGSANSLFGNLGTGSAFSGELRAHFHTPSTPVTAGVFSAGEEAATGPITVNLNILDGQTIESLSGVAVALTAISEGGISPATPATVAGDWSGTHQFCGDDLTQCSNLAFEINFSGSTVSGSSGVFNPAGVDVFPQDIEGSIAQLGEVSTLTFTWNGGSYSGSIFFLPGSDTQLVFLGETPDANAANGTIATLLTR